MSLTFMNSLIVSLECARLLHVTATYLFAPAALLNGMVFSQILLRLAPVHHSSLNSNFKALLSFSSFFLLFSF